ncbi:hypothetical protein V495_00936 [Pseudogymnoascus sp. VKM F-4514 (FW-929)]|nr:hypothetical protein V490_04783 [Pseudogymnoascus sp. VKM F-3557]KFY48893.1 hypothetical protein V495_00936 [Pseudogymnoascus sp. VKM F-4514 (FW-929)]KFY66867.1 hypothetical protein V497_00650 [Pseudogymnoascus sp. VKM F-4516 (FW-969)]
MATPGEVDIGQLSQSQQEALQQYTAVTDQEVQAAVPILQRAQWNVQLAVSRFFDGDTGQGDPLADAIAAAQNAPPIRSIRHENLQESLLRGPSSAAARPDAAPRIVPQPEDQVARRPPLLLGLLFMPFNVLYKILSSSFGFFAYLFPFLPRLFQPRTASGQIRRRNTTGRRMLSPQDTAARFKREFDEEYGSNTLPFFTNGYAQALDLAKKDLKFLMIIIMSPEHDDTSSFIRDTLLSPEVTALINDPSNNIVLWAGNVQDSEAYQVSTALRCTKFPFTALITHTAESGPTSMSVVARLTGPMSASTYTAKLQNTISTYTSQLTEARQARSAQQFERTLRQEQDSAYERSLAQDRERARQRREEEAAQAAEEQRAREAAAAADKYAANLDQWKRWRVQNIPSEPPLDVKNAVRVAFRMPESAERITRRFSPDAPLEELYAFVECYGTPQESDDGEAVSEPVDFEHEYKFRLVSPMPREVYDLAQGGSVLDRIGKSGNLIVEPILDDEDVEADE